MTDNRMSKLSRPFPASAVGWKPGAPAGGNNRQALGFVDLRLYYARLDTVAGEDWSNKITIIEGQYTVNVIVELTIFGVTRMGDGSARLITEKADGAITVNEIALQKAVAQAFKRAAAMFGIGAYLYGWKGIKADYQGKSFTQSGYAFLNKTAIELTEQAMLRWEARYKRAEEVAEKAVGDDEPELIEHDEIEPDIWPTEPPTGPLETLTQPPPMNVQPPRASAAEPPPAPAEPILSSVEERADWEPPSWKDLVEDLITDAANIGYVIETKRKIAQIPDGMLKGGVPSGARRIRCEEMWVKNWIKYVAQFADKWDRAQLEAARDISLEIPVRTPGREDTRKIISDRLTLVIQGEGSAFLDEALKK